MFSAFSKSIAQLPDPSFRKVLITGVIGSLLSFFILWAIVTNFLFSSTFVEIGWVDTVLDWLGSLASLAVIWVFFPAVASVIIGFLLDDIANAVENKHYPNLPKAN